MYSSHRTKEVVLGRCASRYNCECIGSGPWCSMADCPSGQWERTVNPSAYAYVGSNPTSATQSQPRSSNQKIGADFFVSAGWFAHTVDLPICVCCRLCVCCRRVALSPSALSPSPEEGQMQAGNSLRWVSPPKPPGFLPEGAFWREWDLPRLNCGSNCGVLASSQFADRPRYARQSVQQWAPVPILPR